MRTGSRSSISRPHATCARPAPRPPSMRSKLPWTSSRSHSSSIRWNCAYAAIRIATSMRSALQQQGVARMLPSGRRGVQMEQAQPGAAVDARGSGPRRLGHGDRRLGRISGADHGAHRAHRQWPCRSRLRDLRHWHRHLHHHGAGRGRYAGTAARNISIKLGDSSLPQSPVEGGSWIAASVANGIATTAARIRNELLRLAKQMPGSPLADAGLDDVGSPTASS